MYEGKQLTFIEWLQEIRILNSSAANMQNIKAMLDYIPKRMVRCPRCFKYFINEQLDNHVRECNFV